MKSDDGTLTEDCALSVWSKLLLEATIKVGQAANRPAQYGQWMREAGFINTKTVVYKWPTNPWPKDKTHKTMGLWNHYNVLQGLQGFTIGLFTRVLGWSPDQIEALLVDVRKDLQNRHIHAYWPMLVLPWSPGFPRVFANLSPDMSFTDRNLWLRQLNNCALQELHSRLPNAFIVRPRIYDVMHVACPDGPEIPAPAAQHQQDETCRADLETGRLRDLSLVSRMYPVGQSQPPRVSTASPSSPTG